MRIIKEVAFDHAVNHEVNKHRGIRIENLPKMLGLPKDEIQTYLIELEDSDASSLYLWGENERWCRDCRLSNLDKTSDALAAELRRCHDKPPADIRGTEELMLTAAACGLPMTATDGNHRLMSQFIHFSLDGVRAYLCTHRGLKPGYFQARQAHELSKCA